MSWLKRPFRFMALLPVHTGTAKTQSPMEVFEEIQTAIYLLPFHPRTIIGYPGADDRMPDQCSLHTSLILGGQKSTWCRAKRMIVICLPINDVRQSGEFALATRPIK